MSSKRAEYQALLDAVVVQLQRTQGSVSDLAAIRNSVITIVNAHLVSEGKPVPSWPEETPAP